MPLTLRRVMTVNDVSMVSTTKSKESFVIDRNKLETSIEQLAALKRELNAGSFDTKKVPSNKCDTKVQAVPPGFKVGSEESKPLTKLSYSDVLKTNKSTTPDVSLHVTTNLELASPSAEIDHINPSKSDKKKDDSQNSSKSGAWSNNEEEDEINPSKSDKKKDDSQNSSKSGAWSNNEEEDEAASSHGQFRRSKSLSRTKKVKKYLSKKIKEPLVAAVEDKVSGYLLQWILSCDQESSQNDSVSRNVSHEESAAKYNIARSRSSWYVYQEKREDTNLNSDNVSKEQTKIINEKSEKDKDSSRDIKKHISRCSLIDTHSKESLSSIKKAQNNVTPVQTIPRKLKQSKSVDGGCNTFERHNATYKSLDNRIRENRLSYPSDVFHTHTALSAQNQIHTKSKESFVIDRNKLETSIEQLAALKRELNAGSFDTKKVPSNKCDTKVQAVPPASSSKSNPSSVQNKQVSPSSESIPKISLVPLNQTDLSGSAVKISEESKPLTKLSYSDVLKTNKSTNPDVSLHVTTNLELASPSAEIDHVRSISDTLDDSLMPISEDSGIADLLSYSEDCTDRLSISEDFSLSAEDLVSCVDFLDLNTESIVPAPCSTLSSSASFNSSLETVISASNDNLEDEEEYVTKVPPGVKGQSELTSLVDRFIGPYYLNYETTRNILIRQGRDIFLCSYFGDVDKFRTGFCVPASNLMDEIFKKAKVKGETVSLRSWML
ncbi:dentin sialophosphoprotein-like [Diaphorina citri]|uniref:Dentin sialophosphoprotein-like n=1 Tax=Diaphorina citri TaxID=121845 RepID=A0A3Q0ILU3_DIACI|nr:dentin sialophosphoprotein-like [Diaphorina citri]